MIAPEILDCQIEALLFTGNTPLATEFASEVLSAFNGSPVSQEEISASVDRLNERYEQHHHALIIKEISGGYKLLSHQNMNDLISFVRNNESKRKLSRAALETLSIIVYKQPVTRAYIESIRGVNSDYALQKLLDKGLAKILGTTDDPGRPLIYGAGDAFLEHFGLKGFENLPPFREALPKEEIGTEEE
jgi:segregation and condensation protein B